jgi:hypothetical protein
MTTKRLPRNRQSRLQRSSGLAIFFLLLGLPHIYSALRKQPSR